MKELYIITHTESRHHIQGVMGGWSDSELTDKGKADAVLCARRLKELDLDRTPLLSSDLKRAVQTSQIIAQILGSQISLDSRLREMTFGEAEGKSIAWYKNKVHAQNKTNAHRLSIIDGQKTIKQFAIRLFAVMNEYYLSYDKLIIITHCYATTFLIAYWIKMPIDSITNIKFNVIPGSISYLSEDDSPKTRSVVYLGDTRHLKNFKPA